jgi:hypothetical protein
VKRRLTFLSALCSALLVAASQPAVAGITNVGL